MSERQTKENLEKVIEEEMNVFKLEYKQILTVTSDNGNNMLAAVRYMKHLMGASLEGESLATLLRKEYEILQSIRGDDEVDTVGDAVDVDLTETDLDTDGEGCKLELLPEDDDFAEKIPNSDDTTPVEETLQDLEVELDILESVRCGAHTAQLAVWDVLREYKTRLSNINKMCLKMHHRANRQTLIFHKTPLPPKVCETRWNVWYLLLRYLKTLEGTPLLEILKTNDSEIGKCCLFIFFIYIRRIFSIIFLHQISRSNGTSSQSLLTHLNPCSS